MDSKLPIIYTLTLKREFSAVNYMYDLVKKRYNITFYLRIEIFFFNGKLSLYRRFI